MWPASSTTTLSTLRSAALAILDLAQRRVAIGADVAQHVGLRGLHPEHRAFDAAPACQHFVDSIQRRIDDSVRGIAGDAKASCAIGLRPVLREKRCALGRQPRIVLHQPRSDFFARRVITQRCALLQLVDPLRVAPGRLLRVASAAGRSPPG